MTNFKPNNIIRVPCKRDDVFRYWLEFLLPFHNMSSREMDVAVALLKERYELCKVILDKNLVNKTLLNSDTAKKIMEECELSACHYKVIVGKLRSKNFILDNEINPRLIPNVKEVNGSFQLLLIFDY